jgi:hypothetical protein
VRQIIKETVIKGSSGKLITLRPRNKEQGISYGYKTSYTLGIQSQS